MSKKQKPPEGPFAKLADMKARMVEEEARAKEKPKGATAPRPPQARVSPRQAKQAPANAEEEALAFHRLMSGVVPLESKHERVTKTADVGRSGTAKRLATGKEAREREEAAAHERLHELAFGGDRFEVTDDGRHVEGCRVDLPPDLVRKLRRGQFPIDARLDLHGMRAEEAKTATIAFLRDKRTRGERCVLLIHGRGEHSAGPAVLRGEVATWLSQTSASEHVAAFATARDGDGGEGAVYVLLRR